MHGCDVLNKRGFARPYVLSEHILVFFRLHKTCETPVHKNELSAHAKKIISSYEVKESGLLPPF